MAEIIDSWEVFDIALTSTPAGTPPPPAGTPPPPAGTTQPGQSIRNLAPGDYNLVVTKSRYRTVTATIRVNANGYVSCVSGPCGGSRIPRVSIENNAVRVFMKMVDDPTSTGIVTEGGSPDAPTGATGDTPTPAGAGGMCGWIRSIGGWKSITWNNVLAVKYAYLDPANYSAGFSGVSWDDVLGVKYYYYGIKENDPANGNQKANCGFA